MAGLSKKNIWKKIKKLSYWGFFWIIWLVTVSRFSQERIAKQNTFSEIQKIPDVDVGLLLWTTKILKNGKKNLFFIYRINAAVSLYKEWKIDYILVSGDNGRSTYDEASDMFDELVKHGVASWDIVLDYAWFRTLDSVIRAQKVFWVKNMTIISQKFHTTRALTICYLNGLECLAYPAQDVPINRGPRVLLRETLARVLTYIDHVIARKPHFLGEEEETPWK